MDVISKWMLVAVFAVKDSQGITPLAMFNNILLLTIGIFMVFVVENHYLRDKMKKFCGYQERCKDDILCLAHLHESRCFNCPYKSFEDSQNRQYPCSDAKRCS
jgi:hypothetical protein